MNADSRWALWLRWVGANALAELLGLGLTFAAGYAIFTLLGEPQTVLAAIGMIVLTTATGLLEGTLVGLVQWSVLRRPLPGVTRRAWWVATVAGALVAWFLGSLPSTLIGLSAQGTETPAQEPGIVVVVVLAAAMGAFLGLVLGYPQWRVLRHAAEGARLWIPANAAAWALGMPLVFVAVDLAQRPGSPAAAIAVMAAALVLIGAVVGAVHGLALVRMVSPGAAVAGQN